MINKFLKLEGKELMSFDPKIKNRYLPTSIAIVNPSALEFMIKPIFQWKKFHAKLFISIFL